MFRILFFILALLVFWGVYGLTGRICTLRGIRRTGKNRLLLAALSLALAGLCLLWNTLAIVLLYLLLFSALTDLTALVVKRLWKKRADSSLGRWLHRAYHSCLIPLCAAVLVLCWGFYNMANPVQTVYTLQTDKLSEALTVVLLSDTHYDTIQSPDAVAEIADEIRALSPDLILLGGDLVEEGTSKASMEQLFELLGSLESRFGTYYVYGNHDRQFYSTSPAYTQTELENAITRNGITILQDESIALTEELLLLGREDASRRDRAAAADLLAGADPDAFWLVLDHQPTAFDEHASLGVDLALSGHTHAGQIFPLGLFLSLRGLNYGLYEQGDSTAIVTSGVAGWGFPLRTQGRSEYVVIRLTPAP